MAPAWENGDPAFCLSLLEKWVECGHSHSRSLPEGNREDHRWPLPFSFWKVELFVAIVTSSQFQREKGKE